VEDDQKDVKDNQEDMEDNQEDTTAKIWAYLEPEPLKSKLKPEPQQLKFGAGAGTEKFGGARAAPKKTFLEPEPPKCAGFATLL